MRMAENAIDDEQTEEDEKRTILRASSCAADIKLSSADEYIIREGLRMMGMSAENKDGYGLFCLGFENEWGLHGVKKDEERAKVFYERSLRRGFLNEKDIENMKQLFSKEWDPSLYYVRFSCITTLNLRGSNKRTVFYFDELRIMKYEQVAILEILERGWWLKC